MIGTQVPARGLHGSGADPGDRYLTTVGELFTDWYSRQAAYVRGGRYNGHCPDWRLIRAAEASARETGMRASTPYPAAARTPDYAADLARWGSGRGIGPDGPEAAAGPEAGQ